MCVARYASHYFSKGAICVPLDDREKTYVPCLRIEPPGSFMRRCLRIEHRSELYAKEALCGSTRASLWRKKETKPWKHEFHFPLTYIIKSDKFQMLSLCSHLTSPSLDPSPCWSWLLVTSYWFICWLLIRFTGYWFIYWLLIHLLVTDSFTDSFTGYWFIYWLLIRLQVTDSLTGYWFIYWLLIRYTGYWFDLMVTGYWFVYWLLIRFTGYWFVYWLLNQ